MARSIYRLLSGSIQLSRVVSNLQVHDGIFANTVKLGYNELGYNEQILKPNWLF